MDGVAPRRHLPSWMLGITATDQACTSKSRGGSQDDDLEELPRETCKSKPKLQIVQSDKEVEFGDESMKINSRLIKKCKAKGSGRKLRKQVKQIAKGKENCAVTGGNFLDNASSKKRKAKNFKIQPCSETEVSIPSEDELSVEDFVSIAKEYVSAHEAVEQHQPSCIVPRSDNLPTSTTLLEKESSDVHNALQGNRNSLRDSFEASDADGTKWPPAEQSIIDSGKIGDPAREMLDLFLGPLLKKPIVERKTDVLAERTMLNHKQSKESQDYSVEVPPLTKKKCSLKDRVATLLN